MRSRLRFLATLIVCVAIQLAAWGLLGAYRIGGLNPTASIVVMFVLPLLVAVVGFSFWLASISPRPWFVYLAALVGVMVAVALSLFLALPVGCAVEPVSCP